MTVHYEAGIFQVNEGTKIVARLHGGPGTNVGQQGLALAQRYARHCYLGRANTRTEDRGAYIFDYWRDPTGKSTDDPGRGGCLLGLQQEQPHRREHGRLRTAGGSRTTTTCCTCSTTGSDANNGKLVIAKYSHICAIGGDDNQDYTSYFK